MSNKAVYVKYVLYTCHKIEYVEGSIYGSEGSLGIEFEQTTFIFNTLFIINKKNIYHKRYTRRISLTLAQCFCSIYIEGSSTGSANVCVCVYVLHTLLTLALSLWLQQ